MTPKQRNFLRGLLVSVILAATAFAGANAGDLTDDKTLVAVAGALAGVVALFVRAPGDTRDEPNFTFETIYDTATDTGNIKPMYPEDTYYKDADGVIRNTSDTPNA